MFFSCSFMCIELYFYGSNFRSACGCLNWAVLCETASAARMFWYEFGEGLSVFCHPAKRPLSCFGIE